MVAVSSYSWMGDGFDSFSPNPSGENETVRGLS